MEFRLFGSTPRRRAAGLGLALALLAVGLYAQERAASQTPPAKPEAKPAPKAASEPSPSPSPEVKILARSWERAGDRVYATGDVEVHYADFLLFADKAECDLETKDVVAEGNVVIQSKGEVIRAERVLCNLDSGRATVDRASGLVPPSLLFEAKTLERKQADLYGMTKARFTACAQPNPRWSFDLSRANLKKGDYVQMWNAVLRVKNVPVFYMPYLRYPLRDRATGFLLPMLGQGADKGFLISESFYWAMASNMDATIGLDLYPSKGVGAGLEYRYLFPGGTKGALNLYYFDYKKQSDGTDQGTSSIIRLDHTQALPLGFTLVANVDYQTSFSFLRDFDNNFQRALSFTRQIQAYLSRSWRRFNLSARASRFETYFSQLDDSNVSTSLPQVTFNVFKTKLLAPIYFSMATTVSRTQYGWKSDFAAGTEKRSTRFGISPALSIPFSSIPWLTATTTVTANLNYYGQSLVPGTSTIVDEPLFTHNYQAAFEIVGPVFYRLFYNRAGQPRLKNIIEPFVNYSYDSPTNDAGRIVTNYGYFFRYHQMTYGVTDRFLFKGAGDQAVEVLSLALGQTYYFSPEHGPLSIYPVNGKPPRFSEITSTLRFYPQAHFSLDASASYNPYYKNISSLRLGATAGVKPGGDFLSVNWFTSRFYWIIGIDPTLVPIYNRDQIGAFGGLRLPGINIDLQLEADYNIRDHKLLYTGAQLTYHYQCVDILFDIRSYHYRNPPDTQFRISLGLGSIGRSLDLLGGFGF